MDVTNLLSIREFEQIKNFILKKGDTMTFRNFDNNNPHYKFGTYNTFLGADIWQRNSYNDPTISNFNQLRSWIKEGMKEERVYLIGIPGKGLETKKANISKCIARILKEIKATK